MEQARFCLFCIYTLAMHLLSCTAVNREVLSLVLVSDTIFKIRLSHKKH